MARGGRLAAALAVAVLTSGCAGKPIGGPSSGPVLGGPSSGAPAPASSPASSSSAPARPPAWKPATLPPTTPTSILRDVVATDRAHAWAVGSDNYTPPELYTTGEPLILQWDGSRWSRMPLPGVTWKGGLKLVAAGSPTDVWAVGGPAAHEPSDNVTKVLRYDGGTWHEVPFPAGATPSLLSITDLAVVAGHAWMVGHRNTEAVILEWTGRDWKEHEAPAECVQGGTSFGGTPNFCAVTGLKAFAPNDIWAAGNGAWTGFLGPLLYHWDGTAWRTVRVGLNDKRLALTAIGGRSSNDLWAVGDTLMSPDGGALVVHGDGTTWREVGGLPAARLPDVAVDTAGNPWLIENFREPSVKLASFRGTGPWVDAPIPAPPDAVGMNLNGIAAVPGTDLMFAVGAADLPTQPRRLRAVILEYS
ncbi:MAG TPA: hypothetical protein VGX25_31555 [Actinophytocola sp.]|uniref:hypothetical protein n=1 Tax=Actinophytocola sp. TaxID=1872138 RepID=UPI002DDCFB84|nr:hypothetical protein [Actinophytocola sp.]HEV2783947.1 hypothetical protein [Actinophytocola sp.]